MGIVKVMNFAHGDIMILSSYLCLVFITQLGVSPFRAFFAIIPLTYFIGYLYQRWLLNRVLGKEMDPPLIVAFGVAIILQNRLLLVFTPDARTLMTGLDCRPSLTSDLKIPVNYLIDFLIGLAVISFLLLFLSKDLLGPGHTGRLR